MVDTNNKFGLNLAVTAEIKIMLNWYRHPWLELRFFLLEGTDR